MERKRGRVGSTLVSRGDSECSSERRPCTAREQESRRRRRRREERRCAERGREWKRNRKTRFDETRGMGTTEPDQPVHKRTRMYLSVCECLAECVRDRRVTWSSRDFVSATWSLSANVLALVCRPKERDEDAPVHKWIFEVKIEGSASFRLKHDRLRHRCIAARLKYPCVTRYVLSLSLSLSFFLFLSSAFALPPYSLLCFLAALHRVTINFVDS